MKTYIKFLINTFLKSFINIFFIILSLVFILNILKEIEFFNNTDVSPSVNPNIDGLVIFVYNGDFVQPNKNEVNTGNINEYDIYVGVHIQASIQFRFLDVSGVYGWICVQSIILVCVFFSQYISICIADVSCSTKTNINVVYILYEY